MSTEPLTPGCLTIIAKSLLSGQSQLGNWPEQEVTKADFYRAIMAGGDASRQPQETAAQARTRFMKSDPDGQALAFSYNLAKGDDWRPAEPVAKAATMGPCAKEIHDRASLLLMNEAGGSASLNAGVRSAKHAAARVKVRKLHPELAQAERNEERAAA